MSSSVGGGAASAGGDVAGLLEKAKELDQLRKDQDDVATEINKIHKKIISSPEMVDKSVDAILARLRGLYVQAKELAESEDSASNALVGLLDGVLQSGVSAAPRKKMEVGEQKKKRMKSDTDTPRFSFASMRSQLDQAANLKGEQVAAKVKSDDEKDEWFVVKVIHFDKETKEFEVLDEEPGDDEESSAQKFERGSLMITISYLMMTKRTGIYRRDLFHFTGWLRSQRATGNEKENLGPSSALLASVVYEDGSFRT